VALAPRAGAVAAGWQPTGVVRADCAAVGRNVRLTPGTEISLAVAEPGLADENPCDQGVKERVYRAMAWIYNRARSETTTENL